VFEYFPYGQVQRLIDYYAHGTALTVLTDVGDAVGKDAFAKSGHCQQEMIPQAVAAPGCAGGKPSGHSL
jgi:hypothetical protein